jgi:low affinity Fe/Cu permease
MQRAFDTVALWTSRESESARAFMLSAVLVVLWAATGPLFHFSDTWQLIVNTLSSIVTFLMVFVIQNTQDRNTQALQIKIDELLRATQARTSVIGIEDLSQEDLERLKHQH